MKSTAFGLLALGLAAVLVATAVSQGPRLPNRFAEDWGPPGDFRDRPPHHGPGGPPRPGHVLPPFVRDHLELSDEQEKQLTDLEEQVRSRLHTILTPDQQQQMKALFRRGPGPHHPGGGRFPPPPPPDRPEHRELF